MACPHCARPIARVAAPLQVPQVAFVQSRAGCPLCGSVDFSIKSVDSPASIACAIGGVILGIFTCIGFALCFVAFKFKAKEATCAKCSHAWKLA